MDSYLPHAGTIKGTTFMVFLIVILVWTCFYVAFCQFKNVLRCYLFIDLLSFQTSMLFNDSQLSRTKSVFPSCYCRKTYRVEAVVLKDIYYTWIITSFWLICEIRGNFLEIWYFLSKTVSVKLDLKILLHICYLYKCD